MTLTEHRTSTYERIRSRGRRDLSNWMRRIAAKGHRSPVSENRPQEADEMIAKRVERLRKLEEQRRRKT